MVLICVKKISFRILCYKVKLSLLALCFFHKKSRLSHLLSRSTKSSNYILQLACKWYKLPFVMSVTKDYGFKIGLCLTRQLPNIISMLYVLCERNLKCKKEINVFQTISCFVWGAKVTVIMKKAVTIFHLMNLNTRKCN